MWERIRRAFAVDPNRSNGIPINAQFRNPPPAAMPPQSYDDPVTVPAGDIAQNQYFARDSRRSYPRLSVVNQADVVGLLSVGSKAAPKAGVELIGDAGAKQLVELRADGEETGVAKLFERDNSSVMGVLGKDGMPPFPSGMNRTTNDGAKAYVMDKDREEGFPEE